MPLPEVQRPVRPAPAAQGPAAGVAPLLPLDAYPE